MPNKLIKFENNKFKDFACIILGERILTHCCSETRIGKYSLFLFTFEKKDFSFFLAVLCALGFKVGKKC